MPSQSSATGGRRIIPPSKVLAANQLSATGRSVIPQKQEIYVKPIVSTAATVDSASVLQTIATHEAATDPHSEYITESEYGTDIDDLQDKYDELVLGQYEHEIQEMLSRERHSSGIRGYEVSAGLKGYEIRGVGIRGHEIR